MATREENLKKINDELERLSDDELEGVAGGNAVESASDSKFLNSLGLCDRYSTVRLRWENHDQEIIDAWKKVGVDATIHSGNLSTIGKDNVYKIDGNTVSRTEAMEHAKKLFHIDEPGGF